MTDRELLEQILSNQQKMQSDITDMRSDITNMQGDINNMRSDITNMQGNINDMRSDITNMQGDINDMRSDITNMKSDITDMRSDITNMQGDITDIRLHLENVTDRNISLLVENYSNLVKKLDENNSVTDQQIAYQIRVNYLMEDVEKLKKEVAELKNKIA